MNIIVSDNRFVLKSSTQEQIKHSCLEYCIEKREKCSKTEYFVAVLSWLIATYSFISSSTIMNLKIALIILILLTLAFHFSFKVHKESLLIIAPIGLQMTTTYITGHQRVFSLPWQSINDVLIVDVFQTQKVLYYLAVKTSQNGLVTLFQKSAPRLHFLEIMYKDIYRLLENNR